MPSGCSTIRGSISPSPPAARGQGHPASRRPGRKPEELSEVYGRLRAADRPVLEEGRTTCCYAKSEKSWIADPDGIVWEAFLTEGEATIYGDSPALGTLADSLGEEKCCCPLRRPRPERSRNVNRPAMSPS